MPINKIQSVAREVAKKRAQSAKEVTTSRKRAVAKEKSKTTPATVITEPIPSSAMTTVTIAAETTTETTEQIKNAISYIGGKREVSIDRETLSLFHENKLLNDRAYVILCLCMEYGCQHISTGFEFFEEPGELSKFALAYNLEPAKVLSTLAGIKGLVMPLEKMSLQMQLELTFAGE